MTDWIDLMNYAFAVAGLMVALLGLLTCLFSSILDKRTHRIFVAIFSLMIAYTVSDLTSQISIVLLDTRFTVLSQIAVFGESLFSSMLMPILTVYLLQCAGENWRRSPLLSGVVVLWLSYLVLLIAAQFSCSIYYFTPDNVYHRGPWYPVLLVPPALLMLGNLMGVYRRRNALSRRQMIGILVYILLPLCSMLIQMVWYGLLIIVIGTSVAAFFIFFFILLDHMERYMAQYEENLRQQTSILVLQMRPRFIYNTMTSIYYLCGQDAKKAQSVILDFTSYLRQNFTAITREECIPFSEELEHARAYLAVAKARYEDQLYVEFDTPVTAFRIPPLTLQPLVENAVKHGISPDLDPLYLSVKTCEAGDWVEVIVEDTGPGFRPTEDEKPHIALASTRERLRVMCGGKLTIGSRKEGGTVAKLILPK